MYALPYVKQIAIEKVLYNTFNSVLCHNLKGWDGMGCEEWVSEQSPRRGSGFARSGSLDCQEGERHAPLADSDQ